MAVARHRHKKRLLWRPKATLVSSQHSLAAIAAAGSIHSLLMMTRELCAAGESAAVATFVARPP